MSVHQPTVPHRHLRPTAKRGVTLIELTITMVVIGIMSVVAFSVFGMFQREMIKLEIREQMQMIADNELERLMSLSYLELAVTSVTDVWTLNKAGRDFEVAVQVLELPNAVANPRWKEINVTVRFYAGQTTPQEEVSVRVFRSPVTGAL